MKQLNTEVLARRIFSCPTAPFREGWVLKTIQKTLADRGIPSVFDPHGNLIGNVNSLEDLQSARLAYMAHTDHPGFHLTARAPQLKSSDSASAKSKAKGKSSSKAKSKNHGCRYTGIWYGGADFAHMKGVKVRVFDPKNKIDLRGRIVSIATEGSYPLGRPLEVELPRDVELSPLAFGAFDFPGFSKKGDRIVTRAADDLAGCVAAAGALMDLSAEDRRGVVGLFTRAEENGFVGCLAFLASGFLAPSCVAVSLEASKTLPLAEIGKGPVLRIGDRSTIFDSAASVAFLLAAEGAVRQDKKLKFQRRLMDGGSCEATALAQFGFRTTGLAVPLGNYHNQGPKGIAPEIISLKDMDTARKLLGAYARALDSHLAKISTLKSDLLSRYEPLAPLLQSWTSSEFQEVPSWATR